MKMQRATLAVASALLAAAGLAAGQASALASPARPAAASPQVLARGSVSLPGGQAGSGVPVQLLAWPKDSVLHGMRPGQQAPMQLIARTVTSRSGQFALGVTADGPLLAAAAPDGIVNLEVVAGTGTTLATANFSRRVQAAGGKMAIMPSLRPAGAAAPASVPLHIAASSAGGAAAAPAAAVPLAGCIVQEIQNFGPRFTTVGETFATVSRVTMGFTYTRGSSSTLEIAASPSGKAGTFTADGSTTTTSTFQATFRSVAGPKNVEYQTEFTYAKFRQICSRARIANATVPVPTKFFVRSTGYAGGAHEVFVKSAPAARFCVSVDGGSSQSIERSRAVTVSGGVTFSALGASLSAQTGYSSDAMITFSFGATHHLCGTRGFPAGTPSQLVAKA
jgi:hypothetical protein